MCKEVLNISVKFILLFINIRLKDNENTTDKHNKQCYSNFTVLMNKYCNLSETNCSSLTICPLHLLQLLRNQIEFYFIYNSLSKKYFRLPNYMKHSYVFIVSVYCKCLSHYRQIMTYSILSRSNFYETTEFWSG